MRRLMMLSLVMCTTWMGCSDDPDPTPDAGTPDDSVRVRSFNRYLTASGFEERPTDVTENPIELFVEEGNELVPVSTRTGDGGQYVFTDVPPGTYYLKVGTSYVVTDSRDVDLSTNILGRPDAGFLEVDSDANLAVSGLEPWVAPERPSNPVNPGSDLRLIAEQVGYSGVIRPTASTGATALNQENAFMFGETGMTPRFDAAKGDRAWLVQHNPRSLGTLPDGGTQNYLTAVRAVHLPPLSHDGSQPLPVQGTLQPLTLNELPLDWKVSSFAAHATEVNPEATLRSNTFNIYPAPYGPAEGWVGYSGDLLNLQRPLGEPSDVTGTLRYGNPFPSSWGLVASASTSFVVLLQVPGDAQPFRASASMNVSDRPAVLGGQPITPRVRPPRGLTVDGTPAYSARSLSPGSHVIAWQPPASGTPTIYSVGLRRLDLFSENSPRFAVTVASFLVSGSNTTLRLPAGLVEPGKHYYVTVRAILAGSYDFARKPFTLADQIDASSGTAVSGLLSIPAQTP
jgi:hypothetical protein